MKQLSIIIPGCNEFPQNAFTVQNVIASLRDTPLDFEIIYVDNCSPDQTEEDKRQRNFLDNKGQPWLRAMHWDEKLSHWCAKNVGVNNSEGEVLLFMDAHCIVENSAIWNMYQDYVNNYDEINGSLHLPINYMLESPGKELVYKTLYSYPDGIAHYSFTRQRTRDQIHKIPCMSTCGMMMSRDIMVNKLGQWPWELGIYGGGENFINFTMGVLGYDVNIWHCGRIHHFAYKRGYSWNYDDWLRNRMIAIYMAGGEDWLLRFSNASKGRPEVKEQMRMGVVAKCKEHREKIVSLQQYTLKEWAAKMYKEHMEYFHQYDEI